MKRKGYQPDPGPIPKVTPPKEGSGSVRGFLTYAELVEARKDPLIDAIARDREQDVNRWFNALPRWATDGLKRLVRKKP